MSGPGDGLGRVLVRWLPAIAWMALIFVLSAQPGLALSEDPAIDVPTRRAAHLGAYAILAVLLAFALRAGRSWPRLALAVVLAVAYGVSDELHQATVPDRAGRAEDVVIDGIGALLGAVAWRLWPLARRRTGASAD